MPSAAWTLTEISDVAMAFSDYNSWEVFTTVRYAYDDAPTRALKGHAGFSLVLGGIVGLLSQ
jgi:hypothetical protein